MSRKIEEVDGIQLSNLNNLNIFQLRELARSVGVSMPTTIRKADLVQKIIKIATGEEKPAERTLRGRPPKEYCKIDLSQLGDSLMQKPNSNEKLILQSWGEEAGMAGSLPDYVSGRRPSVRGGMMCADSGTTARDEFAINDTKDAKGTVRIGQNESWGRLHTGRIGDIANEEVAKISHSVISTYGLKDGDTLECTVCRSLFNGAYSVDKVESINGYPSDKIERTDWDRQDAMNTKDILDFGKNPVLSFARLLAPIGKGQRVLIQGEYKSGKTEVLAEIAKNTASQGMPTIFVALNKRPESKLDFGTLNVDYLFASFDTVPSKQIYMLELAVSKAKRLAEMGEDVVLLIDDLFSIAMSYTYCEDTQALGELGLTLKSRLCTRNILAGGRRTATGSITLVATVGYTVNDADMQRFIQELDMNCNAHISLNKTLYENKVMPFVNVEGTYTDNQADLLPETEIKKANELRAAGKNATEDDLAKLYSKYFS